MTSMRSVIRSIVDGIGRAAAFKQRALLRRVDEKALKCDIRLQGAFDRISTPILVTDAHSAVIYANFAAKKMCSAYQDNFRSVWPDFTGDEIVGVHVDLPANATAISLRTSIHAGRQRFRLDTTAIFDLDDKYIGNVLEWAVLSATGELNLDGEMRAGVDGVQHDTAHRKDEVARASPDSVREDALQIRQTAKTINESSERLTEMSRQLLAHAEATAGEAEEISAASDEISGSVSIMEAGSNKMIVSIKEIAQSSAEGARVAESAVALAESASQTISKLGASSREIGKVVDVIASVGRQTNMLALNATIESAHAGAAGKGFAVVAKEVLQLSKETAGATSQVRERIEAIQSDSQGAIQAMSEIQSVVILMSDLARSIAAKMEEQTSTTNQMGRNVKGASRGAADIASHITGVAVAAQNTTVDAGQTLQAALDLAGLASEITALAARISS